MAELIRPRHTRRLVFAAAGVVAVMGAVLVLGAWPDSTLADGATGKSSMTAVPIAVLGDSGSQSYQDPVSFPLERGERGGALRSRTFQWTEVLDRLRGNQLDSGPWMQWGRPGVTTLGREWLGLDGARAPAKQDFLYNFANSGAGCDNLMRGRFQQAPRLVALMNQTPERWQRGVVVIRIGQNDWGAQIDVEARDPMAPRLDQSISNCRGEIAAAIALIRATHPLTHILVVGVVNEADDPEHMARFRSASETQNLRVALDRFNGMLRDLTVNAPGLAYFDDAAWFEARWGRRGTEGQWAFDAVQIGTTLRVDYAAGDDPRNALLNDHHGGLAWNTLWAQALVERLNEAFNLKLTPITDDEVERFLAPLVRPVQPAQSSGSRLHEAEVGAAVVTQVGHHAAQVGGPAS